MEILTKECVICHGNYKTISRTSKYCEFCRLNRDRGSHGLAMSEAMGIRLDQLERKTINQLRDRCMIWDCRRFPQEFLKRLIPKR